MMMRIHQHSQTKLKNKIFQPAQMKNTTQGVSLFPLRCHELSCYSSKTDKSSVSWQIKSIKMW